MEQPIEAAFGLNEIAELTITITNTLRSTVKVISVRITNIEEKYLSKIYNGHDDEA